MEMQTRGDQLFEARSRRCLVDLKASFRSVPLQFSDLFCFPFSNPKKKPYKSGTRLSCPFSIEIPRSLSGCSLLANFNEAYTYSVYELLPLCPFFFPETQLFELYGLLLLRSLKTLHDNDMIERKSEIKFRSKDAPRRVSRVARMFASLPKKKLRTSMTAIR